MESHRELPGGARQQRKSPGSMAPELKVRGESGRALRRCGVNAQDLLESAERQRKLQFEWYRGNDPSQRC